MIIYNPQKESKTKSETQENIGLREKDKKEPRKREKGRVREIESED